MYFKIIWFFCLILVDISLSFECKTLHCTGKILKTIQLSKIFSDSKHFVDMATKYSENEIISSFEKLKNNITKENLFNWVKNNFYEPGYEINTIMPIDWKKNNKIIYKQKKYLLRNLVKICNGRWLHLSKIFNSSKLPKNSISSFIPLKYPFIVPGGRFKEFYYWDSYWILEGILASNMYKTAANMILNMIDIINKYGFMPNGVRTYFTNRSQPPFLVKMIVAYYEHTNDDELVLKSLSALDREYNFFIKEKVVTINIDGKNHTLNVYKVNSSEPRPESFKEDFDIGKTFLNNKLKKEFYSNVATIAESGWDFSSRWFNLNNVYDSLNRNNLGIKHIIPFDLNALLYYNERQLQRFYCKWASKKAELLTKCFWYGKVARERFESMEKLFLNNKNEWSDFNFTSKTNTCNKNISVNDNNQIDFQSKNLIHPLYISDLSSLWFFNDWRTEDVLKLEKKQISNQELIIVNKIKKINDNLMSKLTHNIESILKSIYEKNQLVELNEWQKFIFKKGGIPISNINSGEQWDYPNAWAPYQLLLIESLLRYHENSLTKNPKYKTLAVYLAQKWLQSNFCSLKNYDSFFEKYHSEKVGKPGEGGEYFVQNGFGWTNGVILKLADILGSEIELSYNCED